MRPQSPKRPYIVALLFPVLVHSLQFMTEQYITTASEWAQWVQTWPITTIWLLALAFSAGLIVGDMCYPNSWVYANWRYFTRKFEIIGLYTNFLENPKRLEIKVLINFVRRVRSSRLSLLVHSYTGLTHTSPHVDAIHVEHLKDIMKGERRNIKIVTLVIPHPGWMPFHSIWGNTPLSVDLNVPVLGHSSRNVVYLELRGTLIPQRHKFYIANLGYGQPSEMPAIYAQDENEDVFKI